MGASIVGIPDRDWGEVPVGFVQIKPGNEAAEQELSEFCRERLASYKVPRIWRFVDQFPQTASSKIQKYVLRELYLAEMAP
jgi:fatty-acyl-CoA synthase